MDVFQEGQLFWPLHGQRTEDKGIHHAEDRGVGADAQRQRERGHERKARTLAKRAHSVARILTQSFNPSEGPHIATGLLQSGRVSKAAAGVVPGSRVQSVVAIRTDGIVSVDSKGRSNQVIRAQGEEIDVARPLVHQERRGGLLRRISRRSRLDAVYSGVLHHGS